MMNAREQLSVRFRFAYCVENCSFLFLPYLDKQPKRTERSHFFVVIFSV
jgi:hypothetical protein